MEPFLEKRLTLFVRNTTSLRSAYRWQDSHMLRLSAFVFTAHDREADLYAFEDSRSLIKKNTGFFSMFRSSTALSAAAIIALAPDRELCLQKALSYYDALKQSRFPPSEFLALAACQCAQYAPEGDVSAIASRARAFYEGMRRQHWFITGNDDVIFSAMLALSPLDVEEGLSRMEDDFQYFKPLFHSGTGVQALSQTLVMGQSQSGARERVCALYETLREKKLRFDRQYGISSLGVLALLPESTDLICQRVAEMFYRLRGEKGFGIWSSASKQELLLFSAGLVALESLEQAKSGVLRTSLSSSIVSLVIAQQTAIAVAAAASAAAASASST